MDPFEFAAPQFIERLNETAVNLENDGADIFFDIPESNSFSDVKENVFSTPKSKIELKEKFFTPMVHASPQVLADITNDETKDRLKLKPKRRSGGAPNKTPKKTEKKLTFDGIKLDAPPPEKGHAMLTRQDIALNSPKFQLRNRVINREAIKRKGSPIKNKGEFHSLAEKVFRFQNDTPPRFRSTSNRPSSAVLDRSKLSVTVAHSPRLLTKSRIRAQPSIAPTVEQPQIKANPINKNVFKVPTLNKPHPRPSTVPEPFKLTEIKKKENKEKSEEPFRFTAKPAPKKSILRSSICSNSSVCSTTSKRSAANNGNMLGGIKDINHQQQSIKIKPFSFEERNKQRQLQKEEKIKKMLQEQIQVPVFHAKPAPSYLTRTGKNAKTKETKEK